MIKVRRALSLALFGALGLSSLVTAQSTVLEVQGVASYGSSVACAGDMNQDGIPDLAIGDDIVGTVDIRSGADGSLIRQIPVSALGQTFGNLPGYDMQPIGDVNADGFDDLLFTKVGDALIGLAGIVPTGPGSATIFSGANGNALTTISAPFGEHSFGYASAVVGDLDGDNKDDFIVTAPWASTQGLTENGFIRAYSSATSAVLFTRHGQANFERFGQSISRAHDVDSDGVEEFVVGTSSLFGSLRVYSGSTALQIQALTAGSTTMSASFGLGYPDVEVAAGHDIDGDGVGDFVLAKRGDETNGFRSGGIFVFSGVSMQVIRTWFGQPCDGIGAKIELIDVNADGFTDVLSASRNDAGHDDDVTVFSGVTGNKTFDTDAITNDMTQLSVVGDVDQDGTADFLGGTDPSGLNPGRVVVVAGGPWLGQSATGNVLDQQGEHEVLLTVNGGAGESARRVDVMVGDAFSFELAQPSSNLTPAGFVIFGELGSPSESQSIALPGTMGDFSIYPVPMVPWAQPIVFTLASSLGSLPGGEILPATPAPWSFNVTSGLGFETTFTLQAVVEESPGVLKATNGVIVRVR